MATVVSVQGAFLNHMDERSNQPLKQSNRSTKVYIRILFLRIGEIDTLNEKYHAHASIEARWAVNFDKLSSNLSVDNQKLLSDGKMIALSNYGESNWHPELYIENALGDPKEQIKYTAKKSKHDNQIYICEYHDIKGYFWEKLELQHFPSDVQDLSISVVSKFYNNKVILMADPYRLSAVNGEAFIDQQEWFLYKHVDVEQRDIEDFHYHIDDREDDEDTVEYENYMDPPKHPVITVTCHVARLSAYFYWNGYCFLMFLTLLSFCIYVTPPDVPGSRIGSLFALILTTTGFRWTLNRSLPPISYLTSFDKYSMMSVFFLIMQCFWVSAIGLVAFKDKHSGGRRTLEYITLDHYVFFSMLGIFILIQIGFTLWLYLVPFEHRRKMDKRDSEYQMSLSNNRTGQNMKSIGKNSKDSPSCSLIPIGTAV